MFVVGMKKRREKEKGEWARFGSRFAQDHLSQRGKGDEEERGEFYFKNMKNI